MDTQIDVRPEPFVNRLVARVLSSPVSGLLDGSLLLLTLRGRRTGREITLPVQYAVGPDAIWVWPGRPETKTWWRNLVDEAPVRIRLRGRDVAGSAVAVRSDAASESFQSGVHAYSARFPRTARRAGFIPAAQNGAQRAPVRPEILVRISVPGVHLEYARAATVVRGSGLAAAIRRYPLGAFLLFTYAYSWGYWIPVALTGGKLSHFPGLMGPMFAAFTVAAVAAGGAGPRDLVSRMARWRVPVRWYAAALVPGIVGLIAVVGLALAGGGWPSATQLSTMPGLPLVGWLGVLALVLVINGYGEEVGWRGHAWPRLRERHAMAGAALILAPLWALWHLPTFWIDSGMRGFDLLLIPGWIIGLASGAVVLGWLYERTNSSLLIVALFHALLNMGSATSATEGLPRIFVSVVVIAWAVVILRQEEARRAEQTEPAARRNANK